jgi:hypothetical protein
MGAHPLNLAGRFLLEIAALAVLGTWAWYSRNDGLRIVAAVSVPMVCAVLWGTFAVPHDPTRSGSAPVPVSGVVRLALEFGFFASATAAFAHLGFVRLAIMFGAAVAIHYVVSHERVRWLIVQ